PAPRCLSWEAKGGELFEVVAVASPGWRRVVRQRGCRLCHGRHRAHPAVRLVRVLWRRTLVWQQRQWRWHQRHRALVLGRLPADEEGLTPALRPVLTVRFDADVALVTMDLIRAAACIDRLQQLTAAAAE